MPHQIRRSDVPAILARHGIPPEADAATLLAALADRGWHAQVEREVADDPRGRPPRYRALAFRRRVEGVPDKAYEFHAHRQAVGRSAEDALGLVLATILERGE